MKKIFHAIAIGTNRFMQSVIIFTAVMMSLLVFWEVLARFVFKITTTGLEAIITGLLVWFFFVGMGFGTSRGWKLAGGFPFKNKLFRRITKTIDSALGLVISLIMIYFAYLWCQYTIDKGLKDQSLFYPLIYVRIGTLVGFVLTEVYLIRDLVRDLFLSRKKEISQEPSDLSEEGEGGTNQW